MVCVCVCVCVCEAQIAFNRFVHGQNKRYIAINFKMPGVVTRI